ncbi:hypothetical protein ACFZAM_31945 [Streptomyces sp. NPDC008079]|uniref:hypothetical protein n=1 Tax=Streptomyces sp. NPDC008079 TaxID=3364806 RepID=UPI0036E9D519
MNMYTFGGKPGRHVDEILPALVHPVPGGGTVPCGDPANCADCAPKFARRRAFYAAGGAERRRLRAELKHAQALDAEEAAQRLAVVPGFVTDDEADEYLF